MIDPFVGLQDNFISLYRKMVVPVFRYHLLRSGDWQEAQALTRQTFLHAQAWVKPGSRDPSEINFWLFSIAVWVQLYKRRSVEIDDSILPTQAQVALFVRAGEVTQAWNALPLRTADALALFMFGGLELAEAGEVVNWDLPTIQERLYVHLDEQVTLRLMADELQPVGYFIGRLETELLEKPTKTKRGAGPFFWRLAYRFNRAMGLSSRILPLVFFLILLFWAIWYFSIPLQPRRLNPPTPTSQPTAQVHDFSPTLDSAILVDESGAVETTILVETSNGMPGISMVPQDTTLSAEFNRAVQSMHFYTGITP